MRRIVFSMLAIGVLVLPVSAAMAGPRGYHYGPRYHPRVWRHVPPRHVLPIPRYPVYYHGYAPAVAWYPPYYGGFDYFGPGFSFHLGY